MYNTLFNKVTDVIEELKSVQQVTEEMYLAAEDGASLTVLPTNAEMSDEKAKK